MNTWRVAGLGRRVRPAPGVCVDGGAYKGQFTQLCLDLWPGCEVHAFEPIPRRANKLRKHFRETPNVTVHEAALGSADGVAGLRILKGNTLSSLLDPEPSWQEAGGERARVESTVEVRVTRLDSVFGLAPDLLKLDLQGAELDALRGAGLLLDGVRALIVELSSGRYRGQSDAAALEGFLIGKGFVKSAQRRHPASWRGAPPVVDALFLRE